MGHQTDADETSLRGTPPEETPGSGIPGEDDAGDATAAVVPTDFVRTHNPTQNRNRYIRMVSPAGSGSAHREKRHFR